ncbi:protein refolding chaperone Spy/CpxP family [Tistlia consotensis]|uniref:Protein refolding chaperone Spy/CpxP family n=1 Tax=Tistlia consotensis USBA 355 TaxID=560819 RepID=A0A1Y6B9M3_9PROT|nr:periplasmic heavy metal sensor [Tistlia consotensis]SME91823.1 protein refolding chaperone Spy/CpxP family [Tistlia consotensis USBA 355]SNR27659.1 protein refolding chaperone Spy/CpxP family [Tistlia consotensis]
MSRSQKLLALALAVSVAINLFVAGAVVSRHFFGPPPHGDWASKKEAVEVLPEAERKRIEQIWESGRDTVRQDFRAMRAARQRYREILTAETFDPAAAQAVLDQLYAKRAEVRETMEQKIMAIATSLPADQRQAYFKAFFAGEARRDKEWAKHDRDDDDRPPPPPE